MNIRFYTSISDVSSQDGAYQERPIRIDNEYGYPNHFFVVGAGIDLEKLQNRLLDDLATGFKAIGFQSKRISQDELWVPEPGLFSARILIWQKRWKDALYALGTDLVKTNRTLPDKVLWHTYQLPVYEEPHAVRINGEIYYESLEAIEPSPVLEVLVKQGYSTKVETTPQEVLRVIMRSKRREYSSRESSFTPPIIPSP
jgi:hypothetical protein